MLILIMKYLLLSSFFILKVGDLPLLSSRDELFANKFDIKNQPITYDCMEEAMFDKIRREYQEEEEKISGGCKRFIF